MLPYRRAFQANRAAVGEGIMAGKTGNPRRKSIPLLPENAARSRVWTGTEASLSGDVFLSSFCSDSFPGHLTLPPGNEPARDENT